jgi:hypothetical protein
VEKIVRIGDPRKINETSRGDDTLRCGIEQNIPQRRSFEWQISNKWSKKIFIFFVKLMKLNFQVAKILFSILLKLAKIVTCQG